MDSSRKPGSAEHYAAERIVGEDQWRQKRGTTLGEVLGSAAIWVTVGFCVGLGLEGQVLHWLDFRGAGEGWSRPVRYAAALGATAVALVAWVWLSARLSELRWRLSGTRLAWGVPLALGSCAVAVLFWYSQSWGAEDVDLELGGRFAFGASPSHGQMTWLRRGGFVGIVSLLHPSEPGEAEIRIQEARWAQELGLTMVLAPLQPERGLDATALDALSELARGDEGPWYVAGGNDPNRLRVGRSLLIRMTGSSEPLPQRLMEVESFERGPVMALEEEIFLAPFPTDGEILNDYLGGSVRSVLSLLDSANAADRDWLDHQDEILDRFGIELHHAPVREEPFEPWEVVRAVEMARSLPRPLVVQGFLTPSVAGEAFAVAWSTGLPPLPERLFTEPLEGGHVKVIAANLAVGPRPAGREFRTLFNRGVRRITDLGGGASSPTREDRELSRMAQLEWYDHQGDDEALLTTLAEGGPWYVYGAGAEDLADRIARRQGGTPTEERESEPLDTLRDPRRALSPFRPATARRTRTSGSEHGP